MPLYIYIYGETVYLGYLFRWPCIYISLIYISCIQNSNRTITLVKKHFSWHVLQWRIIDWSGDLWQLSRSIFPAIISNRCVWCAFYFLMCLARMVASSTQSCVGGHAHVLVGLCFVVYVMLSEWIIIVSSVDSVGVHGSW